MAMVTISSHQIPDVGDAFRPTTGTWATEPFAVATPEELRKVVTGLIDQVEALRAQVATLRAQLADKHASEGDAGLWYRRFVDLRNTAAGDLGIIAQAIQAETVTVTAGHFGRRLDRRDLERLVVAFDAALARAAGDKSVPSPAEVLKP